MKKDITVTTYNHICDEALENFYRQLWRALKAQYGNDILAELLKTSKIENQNTSNDKK